MDERFTLVEVAKPTPAQTRVAEQQRRHTLEDVVAVLKEHQGTDLARAVGGASRYGGSPLTAAAGYFQTLLDADDPPAPTETGEAESLP